MIINFSVDVDSASDINEACDLLFAIKSVVQDD